MTLVTLMSPILLANNDVSCEKHPIFCRIVQAKPSINNKYAMKISNIMHKYKENMDPYISIAIAVQETGIRMINRKQKIIIFDNLGGYQILKGYTDICMYQFHVDTIIDYKLDPVKLNNNLDYCIKSHFKVMKDKLEICSSLNNDAWVCYHSRNEPYHSIYKKLVEDIYFKFM